MVKIGYFASLEQWSPDDCLKQAKEAEQAGFESIWVNDHIHPFFDSLPDGLSAHCGNCWTWLPAALERTNTISIGTGVTAMLYRHHPATIAHRLATLLELYPDRVFLGVGTGHALNETPLGVPWPDYGERAKRTAEAIRMIHTLFTENFVDFDGQFWSLEGMNLYTGPDSSPPIHVAANGETSARMAGELGDGILTGPEDSAFITESLFQAAKTGIDRSEGPDKTFDDFERSVIVTCSYANSLKVAVDSCRQWGIHLLPFVYDHNVSDPRYLQQHAEKVGREQLEDAFLISTDPSDYVEFVEEYVEYGFDRILFMSASPDQSKFCEMMGSEVIPEFR